MLIPSSITVFGGTGFIGRYIVQRLAQQGALIRIPTRDLNKALPLKPAGNVAQVVPFLSSMRSDADVTRAIKGADTVINLIGILSETGRSTFQTMHVEAAARIARIAKEQGVENFVHFSALGANSQSNSKYARSKAAGEDAVRTFFPEAIIFRPSIVFGPEDNFFNKFASIARFAPALPLIGGGNTRFQPVYVGNIADAAIAAIANPATHGQTYELGGSNVYSFKALLQMILQETHRSRYLINLPWGLAKLKASILQLLPNPILTTDQVEMLKTDNVIRDPKAKTLGDLGLTPTALEVILPTYMDRFRAGGRLTKLA